MIMPQFRISRFRLLANVFIASVLVVVSVNANAVTYQVTFNGTWNNNDIKNGAVYPAGAHFTEMIGATHQADAGFWVNGGSASNSVELVAELGANSLLRSELQAAIITGTIGQVVEFNGLFGLPSSHSLEFDIEMNKPFISLMSMIAPSPDWFVGISGVSLIKDGVWLRNLSINLKPYDAGTEEGDQFSLSNPASPSSTVITKLYGTDSPFNGRPTIATLTFTLKNPPPLPPNTNNSSLISSIISLLLN